MVPVGREFGSPDYERLMALDQAAIAAFQSWKHVRDCWQNRTLSLMELAPRRRPETLLDLPKSCQS